MAERAIRLRVNLAGSVADALKTTAAKQGVSTTEAIRRAIALWKLLSDAARQGHRIMLVTGRGGEATYQEIVLR